MRFFAIAIALAAIGCTSLNRKLPRWIVVSDPRVEIPLSRDTATARVGDSVYVEVGLMDLDPDNHGYVVMVNGCKVPHPEWSEKGADLRYHFRARAVGIYDLEIHVPKRDGCPARKRTCVVGVVE